MAGRNTNTRKRKGLPLIVRILLIILAVAVIAGVGIFLWWDRTPPEVTPVDKTIEYGEALLVTEMVEAKDNRADSVKLKIDSASSEDVKVTDDGTAASFPKVGVYEITVTGMDDFKNKTTVNVKVDVVDETAPEFKTVEASYTVPYGADITLENVVEEPVVEGEGETAQKEESKESMMTEIISLSVEDAASETVTLSVKTIKPLEKQGKDGFTLDKEKVVFHKTGSYQMTIAAADESGNEADTDVKIKVVDKTPPVFSATEDTYELPYGREIKAVQKDKAKSLENKIYVTAEDEISDVTLSIAKVEPKGKLSEDSYSLKKGVAVFKKPGTYEVTVKAVDESKNLSEKTVKVSAVDKTKPEFKGIPKAIKLTDENTKYDWMKGVTAKDEIDGDLTKSIEVKSKSVKFGKPGTYMVAYSVKDAAGNGAEKTVSVTITDGTPPVLTVPGPFTVTVGGKAPDYAKGAKAKDAADGEVKVYVDSSKVDLTKAGTYTITYSAKDKSGNKVSKEVKVTVKAK